MLAFSLPGFFFITHLFNLVVFQHFLKYISSNNLVHEPYLKISLRNTIIDFMQKICILQVVHLFLLKILNVIFSTLE
jgi:hypothetical protein